MARENQRSFRACFCSHSLLILPLLEMMRADHQKDVLDVLSSGVINDDVTAIIEKVAADTAQPFKVNE